MADCETLSLLITRIGLKSCVHCAQAQSKGKQKYVRQERTFLKAKESQEEDYS